MQAFLIQHIDDLITAGIGIWMTVFSWRQRERLRASPRKLVRALPVLSPLIIVFALLQFALNSNTTYEWQRASTKDGRASVEFPCATTSETVTDSMAGISLWRQTVKCDVPQRDIELRLSCSEITPAAASLPIKQRLDSLRTWYQRLGFTVISCVPDGHTDIPSYRIVCEGDQGKVRMVMRVVIAPKVAYRAIATAASHFQDDPIISHFVNSFSFQ